MSDELYGPRHKLTFEQAEGAEPLPGQLATKEVLQELRARLWHVVYASVVSSTSSDQWGSAWELRDPWATILLEMHVTRFHRMADEFSFAAKKRIAEVKAIFEHGNYVDILGFIQWVIRHRDCPYELTENIASALESSRAAYRVIDRSTIAPVLSDSERDTLERTFVDLAASEFGGARAHLRAAAECASAGKWADSVRESVHAVESVVRVMEPSAELAKALSRLKKRIKIHPALETGFRNIYGYASDEKGIRHALWEEGAPNVDETDALFMLGACASFVSYLIGKARATELLTGE